MSAQFWCLDRPEDLPNREVAQGLDVWAKVECPINPKHARSGRRLSPLRRRVASRTPRPFIWTSLSDLLCSEEVARDLDAAGLTGFILNPAEVQFPRGVDPGMQYYEFCTVGWGGLPAPAAGCTIIESCSGCLYRRYRLEDKTKLIDPAAWDGSDFFIVWPLPKYTFVSERAAEFFQSKKYPSIALVPVAGLYQGFDKTCAPGRLSHYWPDERARAIGEPLGIY